MIRDGKEQESLSPHRQKQLTQSPILEGHMCKQQGRSPGFRILAFFRLPRKRNV
jgi:hypothetical protein